MGRLLVIVGVAGLLLPGVAVADSPDCARLLRQIYHYEGMVDRADALDNEVWATKTQAHVDLLEDQLAVRCPQYSARDEEQEMKRQFANLMKIAAQAAVKFFTFGAY
jgi:hypothetical protein